MASRSALGCSGPLPRFFFFFVPLSPEAKAKKISLCFGSKRLYNQQFHLEENGFGSHEEWQELWQFARNDSFFLLGSKDESQGNQSCSATVDGNGALTLRIRLPNALTQHGKYLLIPNIRFAYGHDHILKALEEGSAISYRFFFFSAVRSFSSFKKLLTLSSLHTVSLASHSWCCWLYFLISLNCLSKSLCS